LSYRPARLYRLAESIPGLHKLLQIRAQFPDTNNGAAFVTESLKPVLPVRGEWPDFLLVGLKMADKKNDKYIVTFSKPRGDFCGIFVQHSGIFFHHTKVRQPLRRKDSIQKVIRTSKRSDSFLYEAAQNFEVVSNIQN
jgi:hypothetical protein